ncbi:MAG TPA: DUF1080 domain-containing protein [Pyrinomonadaceae bacterium]|nr:DUF1080 domain-containing protein [Pyrinomonadaceae bacterium]
MRITFKNNVTSDVLRIVALVFAFASLFYFPGARANAQKGNATSAMKDSAAPNMLTAAEKKAGWKLLFDGKTTTGWRGFHQEKFPEAGWVVEDGCIKHVAAKGELGGRGGDIITTEMYDNFEMQLEWRLAPGGNSGIKYLVSEDLPKTGPSGVSFEMQVLDDEGHPDAKMGINGNRTAGSLYDIMPAAKNKNLRPVGEFNQVRLIVQGNHIEHWLNGAKVVEFERGSPELKAAIAKSKFKDTAGFGETAKGHILLQDHGDEACFRNIKLRELPATRR